MKTSDAGLQIIKDAERLELKPYICPAGKLTVGWGHVLRRGEPRRPITESEAESYLRIDIMEAEDAVKTFVKAPLSQPQFDALVSLIFNIGRTNFSKSTLLRLLNEGDYVGAAEQFPRWVYAKKKKLPGLVKRRNREQALFLSGTEV